MLEIGIVAYAIRKGERWFIGNQYISPGKTDAVWDEKPDSRWITKDHEQARQMAERIGGNVIVICSIEKTDEKE